MLSLDFIGEWEEQKQKDFISAREKGDFSDFLTKYNVNIEGLCYKKADEFVNEAEMTTLEGTEAIEYIGTKLDCGEDESIRTRFEEEV